MNKNRIQYIFFIFSSLLLFILGGCTGFSSITDSKHLYKGASLNIDSSQFIFKKSATKHELEELFITKPNTKLLWMRPFLCLHQLMPEPKSDSGFWHWMKYKLGEPPSFIEDINLPDVATTIENRLQNHGHFLAKADFEVIQNNRMAKVKFNISPGRPYRLKTITYPDGKDALASEIRSMQTGSLLKTGNNYELKEFENERQRIEGNLKEKGYYYFSADYLLFTADTSGDTKQMKVWLNLKPETPVQASTSFKLKDIYVFDDFSLRDYQPDTTQIDDYHYASEKHLFKPPTILNAVFLEKDSLYSRNDHYATIKHLMAIGVYKFATARFTPEDSFPGKMKVNLLLTPLKKISLSAEMAATIKSTDFAGPGLKLSYKNRNLLRGAELLSVTLGGNFETQLKGDAKGQTSYQIVLEAALTLPKFEPFRLGKQSFKTSFPKTIFTAGGGIYSRVGLYDLQSLNLSIGYSWRSGERISHLLRPVDISFTDLANSTAEFEEYLQENPNVRRSFEDQFTIGGSYNFIYSNIGQRNSKNNFYLNESIDLSGNLASLASTIGSGTSPTPENPKKVFGQPYSQYTRFRNEVRYFYHVSKTTHFGWRLIIGAGIPYTNSTTIPYNKQFFAGGPSSIRAFYSRSVGPGIYQVPDSISDISIDQGGDINMETSIEYRFDIYKNFKGALFTDAGNTWLVNEDPQRPGGKFNSSTFYKQLAVGTGVGFRFDFTFIILRFDVAFPLRKPYLPEGEQWVIDEINPGSSSWRNENIIWNIAIGYPF